MDSKKSTFRKILDFFDVTVTSVCFLIIFITFMISIISRYALRIPVTWSYEVSILGYMWTMFFGVGRALKNDEHVIFSLVYDKLDEDGQRRCRIVYNVLLAILLILIFIPGVNSMLRSNSKTGVLKIPFKVAFAPFFFMLAECIVVSVQNVIDAVKNKSSHTEGKEDK